MTVQTILLIEDAKVDRFYAHWIINDLFPTITIIDAHDGMEALDYLQQCDSLPDMIFLDINMPRMNGFGFLEQYAKENRWTSPLFMLTSSKHQSDMETLKQYSSYISGFLEKPLTDSALQQCLGWEPAAV